MIFRNLRAEWIVAGASNIRDPDARRAYLDSSCAGNEPLREKVEALLATQQPASGAPSGPPPVPLLSEPASGTARPGEASPRLAAQPSDSRWARRHPVLIGLAVVLLALVVGVGVSKVVLGLRSARSAPPIGGEGLPQEPVDAMTAEAAITNLPISLAAWTNAPHHKGWVPPLTPERVEGHGLLGLDPGRHVLRKIEFDVNGLVQLSSIRMRDERHGDYPERVDGIKVGACCHRLHFLQACLWNMPDGTEVGRYVIHFADGEKLEVPIVFGVDLRDWQVWAGNAAGGPADTAVAWRGTNDMAPIRLFRTSWDNPKDGVVVDRIDFVSAMTLSAPFLVGITAQQFSPATPDFWLSCARALEQQGKTADVLALLDQGTARLPTSVVLWTKLGAVQQAAGRTDDAYRTFCRAILIAETNEMVLPADRKKALLARCDFLRRQERFVEAAADYRAAHDLPLPSPLEDGVLINSPADHHLASNITMFLGATNQGAGLELIDWGDGQTEPAQWDGQDCRTLSSVRTERYAYFQIDPTFKFTCGSNVLVEVEYFDSGRGIFGVHFDGVGRDYGMASISMPLRDSQRWLTARFRLNNVRFENSQNARADFRIWARSGPLSVRRVTVLPERSLPKPVTAMGANRSKPPIFDPIPSRDPQASTNLIKLDSFYNASISKGWLPPLTRDRIMGKGIEGLPPGIHAFNGVEFDVRGLIQLSGTILRDERGGGFPEQVIGIKMGRMCQRLHFLHSTGWAMPNGTQIGRYVLHYANGQTNDLPIVYGEDLRVWDYVWDDVEEAKTASVAWIGSNQFTRVHLFSRMWVNPFPEVRIKSIDFISTMTKCAPFMIAITAD